MVNTEKTPLNKKYDASLITTELLMATLLASSSVFLVGWNRSVVNSSASVVFPNHSTLSWALAVSGLPVGALFGAYQGGLEADSYGRRAALMRNSVTYLVAGAMQALSININMIIISRLIVGFAVGYSLCVAPIYINEIAPPSRKGQLGTMTQFSNTVGILAADVLALQLAAPFAWRFLYSITGLVALTQIVFAHYLLESPRYLLRKDRDSIEARDNIRKLQGFQTNEDVEREVCRLVGEIDKKELAAKTRGSFVEMMQDPVLRRLVFCAFILRIGKKMSGTSAVFYYSSAFFTGILKNPNLATVYCGTINVIAAASGLFIMDKFGRKTLVLWSIGGMTACCFLVITTLLGYFSNYVVLLSLLLYLIFYEVGLGPIPHLVVPEMFEAEHVAIAMQGSSTIHWSSEFFIGISFPYMQLYLGAYSFLPFAIILFFVFVYLAKYLPETRGVPTSEIHSAMRAEFAAGNVVKNRNVDETILAGTGSNQILQV